MPFTFTPSNVLSSNLVPKFGIAVEAIDAGLFIFKDADFSSKLRKATNATEAAADVVGFSIASAAAGQPLAYVDFGTITAQAGAFTGLDEPLVLDVGGKAQTVAEFLLEASPAYLTILGWIVSSTQFKLHLATTGELRQPA